MSCLCVINIITSRTATLLSPQYVLSLPPVQIEQLEHEHVHGWLGLQIVALFQGHEEHIVRTVYRVCDTVYGVRAGDAPSQLAAVFNVIDEQ